MLSEKIKKESPQYSVNPKRWLQKMMGNMGRMGQIQNK